MSDSIRTYIETHSTENYEYSDSIEFTDNQFLHIHTSTTSPETFLIEVETPNNTTIHEVDSIQIFQSLQQKYDVEIPNHLR